MCSVASLLPPPLRVAEPIPLLKSGKVLIPSSISTDGLPIRSLGIGWRRGWDSNPRLLSGEPLFESGAFSHSATSPTISIKLRRFIRSSILHNPKTGTNPKRFAPEGGIGSVARSLCLPRPRRGRRTHVSCAHPLRSFRLPPNFRGSPGESRSGRDAFSHSATSPYLR